MVELAVYMQHNSATEAVSGGTRHHSPFPTAPGPAAGCPANVGEDRHGRVTREA